MILIYSTHISSRLEYSCSFIFKDQLQTSYVITSDADKFKLHEGIKINYSNQSIANNELQVKNVSLLFETDINPQKVECFESKGYKAFYKTGSHENANQYDFDIFAASFYLLSRYEEYLPHQQDAYGRYGHENSLAFKEGFLQIPLINCWIADFAKKIQQQFPSFIITNKSFSFLPTYDIDMAYSFKHKGLLRNIGGFIKAPSVNRIKVLAGLEKDPFDVYDWLQHIHEKYKLQPVYFFLLAQKYGQYDKNILPHKTAIKKLLQQHAATYSIGIHPSWQSGDNFLLLKQEKKIMETVIDRDVNLSRQHYIRFHLPSSYRRLQEAGITDDYSMGYGSINGFRASTGNSFYWFDLEKNEISNLKIHPFCFMDANSFYEQHQNAATCFTELQHYYNCCKQFNTTLCTIWHNNFLGTDPQFEGWKDCYEKFITLVQQ